MAGKAARPNGHRFDGIALLGRQTLHIRSVLEQDNSAVDTAGAYLLPFTLPDLSDNLRRWSDKARQLLAASKPCTWMVSND